MTVNLSEKVTNPLQIRVGDIFVSNEVPSFWPMLGKKYKITEVFGVETIGERVRVRLEGHPDQFFCVHPASGANGVYVYRHTNKWWKE